MDAKPASWSYSGHATITAKRDGYWQFLPPWYHKAKESDDSGTIYATLTVWWAIREAPSTTYSGSVVVPGGSGSVSHTPGEITQWRDWKREYDPQGKSTNVGGNEHVNKSAHAHGSFEEHSFDHKTSYTGVP